MNRPASLVIRHWSLVIPRRRRRGGFALLITITLLAFLVLLLVSLASLTRVETQVAANNQSLAQARQNALMALNIALGQLQKYTGPDQRVTAKADVTIPSSVSSSITPTTTGAAARILLDTYWAASRNRHWTGAWQNTNTTPVDATNSKTPAGYNPIPSPTPMWLVSGNEAAATFLPTTAPTNLAYTSSASDDTIKGAADADYPSGRPYRVLVGKNSTAAVAPADLERFVTAPQVPIKSTSAPGSSGASITIGNYAWWVGDEGVKARANLVDPYSDDTSVIGKRIRLQSAQRPAIEAMTTTGADGLAATYPANGTDISKVTVPGQLGLLNTAASHQSEVKARFHDLTTSSRGILADVKNGGLKRDLSYILSRPDLSALRTALNTTFTGGSPFNIAPLGTSNPAISAESTSYAAGYPDRIDAYLGVSFEGNSSYPGIFAYSATWEQLWSFFNMGNRTTDSPAGVFDAAGNIATARPVSETQQGLYPVIVQAKVFYRLRIAGGTIWVDIAPQVVLANPYTTTLSGKYVLKLRSPTSSIRVRAGHYEPDPAGGPDIYKTATSVVHTATSINNYMGDINLIVRSDGIPSGEAHIFTLESDVTIPSSTAAQANVEAIMVNDLDPSNHLTFDTGKPIPSGETHAHLEGTSTSIFTAHLYIDNDTSIATRVSVIDTYRSSGAATSGKLVDPVSSGVQQGGGIWLTYDDGICLSPQQSPFYQINYRAMRIASAGYSSENNHPLQWVHNNVRYGVTGSHDATNPPPNDFFYANLLRPGSSLTNTRWGLVNNGEGPNFNVTQNSIGGPSSSVGLTNLLFDLPKPAAPLTSLGQLQHFNTAGHRPLVIESREVGHIVHQWQVNYPISNSYPNPRVPRHQVFDLRGDFSYNYDGSYLWNDLLWDRFYFSSYPQSGAFDFSTAKLINARYAPFRDTGTVPLNDSAQFRGVFLAAQNLLVDAAFNINSTSVDAWKAVFSSLKNVPVGTEAAGDPTPNANLSAPFARTLTPLGGSTDAKDGNSDNAWKGFRNLTSTEINDLAEEMVLQVRLRGPFLSMAEFVNRRLVTATGDSNKLGLSGALQSAIDKVLNKQADIQGGAPFTDLTKDKGGDGKQHLVELDYRMPTRISGFPGYLLQADVLSSLGPTLAARSDTFTIRTYGDVVNPATSAVEGRAWCEAVVQRTPDYVVTKTGSLGNAPDETASDPANIAFGRRYKIVSFRWLGPDDI